MSEPTAPRDAELSRWADDGGAHHDDDVIQFDLDEVIGLAQEGEEGGRGDDDVIQFDLDEVIGLAPEGEEGGRGD